MYNYLTITIVAVCLLGSAYYKGYSAGKETITEQWEAEKQATNKVMLALRDRYNEQEKEYTSKTQELVVQLHEKESAHKLELNNLTHDYNNRLLKSEQRASHYQYLSRNSSDTCQNLADYSTRFDQQLESGIRVVRELKSLIELRDSQLRAVREQLVLMEKAGEH